MMDLKDLFLAPIYLFLFIIAALIYIQFNNKDELIRKYFLNGLLWRFVGCLGFCMIYEFYYGYGDTFVYFKNSLVLMDLFSDHPMEGFYNIFIDEKYLNSDILYYTNRISNRYDPASFFAVKLAAFFNFFTFGTYFITSLMFAFIGYFGSWKLFRALVEMYPDYHKEMSIACLYFPSVVFWGSGLMKDTICIGALGWMFFAMHRIINVRDNILWNSFVFIICGYVLYVVKIYILLCFIPSAFIYIFIFYNSRVKNEMLRKFLRPMLLTLSVMFGLIAAFFVAEEDARYNADAIAKTSQITGDYIKSESTSYGNNASAYDLGKVEFTPTALAKLIPMGIIVTLFRPFIWEIKNPVMLLSALESFYLLVITFLVFKRNKFGQVFSKINSDPYLIMALIFSLTFAFAVGISTNNFGTLARYKLPMISFYVSATLVLLKLSKNNKSK